MTLQAAITPICDDMLLWGGHVAAKSNAADCLNRERLRLPGLRRLAYEQMIGNQWNSARSSAGRLWTLCGTGEELPYQRLWRHSMGSARSAKSRVPVTSKVSDVLITT